MSEPKVSIIVPVYNVEMYIRECLESLTNQTLKEIEIILVNDCATDNSRRICEEFALKDPRIRLINNKENLGSGLSRNKGIEIANGEYLGFVDPDDWVDLDFYDKLYEKAANGNYDIVKANCVKICNDENKRRELQTDLRKKIEKGLKENIPLYITFHGEHTTAIYKKELQRTANAKYEVFRNSGDLIFLLQVTFYCKSIAFADNVNYYYRIHINSIDHRMDKEYYASHLKNVMSQLDFINSKDETIARYIYFIRSRFSWLFYVMYRGLSSPDRNTLEIKSYYFKLKELFTKVIHPDVSELLKNEYLDSEHYKDRKKQVIKLYIKFWELFLKKAKSRIPQKQINLLYQDMIIWRIEYYACDKKNNKKRLTEIRVLYEMFIKHPEIIRFRVFWYFLFFRDLKKIIKLFNYA